MSCRIAALVVTAMCSFACAAKHNPNGTAVSQPQRETPLSDAEKKLDRSLLMIVRSPDPAATARELRIETREKKIKVEIVATSSGAVAALKTQLQTLGASNIRELDNHVWAYIPVASLTGLSQSDQVTGISLAQSLLGAGKHR